MFLGDDQKQIWMVIENFQLPNLAIEITWSHSSVIKVFWLVNLVTKN
jgi:hypothetical protein